ncbi:MAG TPA: hypothetical protein VF316_22545 [Polyangiaceae bacterium]
MDLLKRLACVWLVGLVASCKPELEGRPSLVTGPRVLAVRGVPAEGEPRDPVTFDALVVDGAGTMATPPLSWSFCVARKPIAELGSVANACVTGESGALQLLGDGATVTSKLPQDACRNFGPEVPSPKKGEDPGRPIDPDSSGGYYQPLRVDLAGGGDALTTFASARLSCGVAGASSAESADFRARYHVNVNPVVARLSLDGADVADGASVAVRPGAAVALVASWASCPQTDTCGDGVCGADESRASCTDDCAPAPKGCTGAERYVAYDAESRAVQVRRESVVASWFATGGSFSSDRSGRDGADVATDTQVTFTAPSAPGALHAWVVLRDERAGVGWRSFVLDVR